MKYQVIIIHDEEKNKDYYQSYVASEDVSLGNMECTDLPPYADVMKAKSCYWNPDTSKWIFDKTKHAELLAAAEQEQRMREEAAAIAASIPSNEEIAVALMDIAEQLSVIAEAVDSLQNGGV